MARKGRDRLTGGEGAGIFVIDTHDGNPQPADVVTDFASGTDVLLYPGASDPLPAARFLAADDVTGVATSATFMVCYDTDSGRLWLDFGADSGLSDRLLIAVLHGAPTLQASDLIVVERYPDWLM
jgi:Ca2+-binding RTX toxin-like protein